MYLIDKNFFVLLDIQQHIYHFGKNKTNSSAFETPSINDRMTMQRNKRHRSVLVLGVYFLVMLRVRL